MTRGLGARWLLPLALLAGLVACAPKEAAVDGALLAVADGFARNFNAKDADGMAALYAADARRLPGTSDRGPRRDSRGVRGRDREALGADHRPDDRLRHGGRLGLALRYLDGGTESAGHREVRRDLAAHAGRVAHISGHLECGCGITESVAASV